MTQNVHVCTICSRSEVVYDVISGRNVKTIKATLSYILKSLSLIVSEIFQKTFRDGGGGIKRKRIRVSLKKQFGIIALRSQSHVIKLPMEAMKSQRFEDTLSGRFNPFRLSFIVFLLFPLTRNMDCAAPFSVPLTLHPNALPTAHDQSSSHE